MYYITNVYIKGVLGPALAGGPKSDHAHHLHEMITKYGLKDFSKTTKSKDHKIGIFSKWEKGEVVLTANFEVK